MGERERKTETDFKMGQAETEETPGSQVVLIGQNKAAQFALVHQSVMRLVRL